MKARIARGLLLATLIAAAVLSVVLANEKPAGVTARSAEGSITFRAYRAECPSKRSGCGVRWASSSKAAETCRV